MFWGFTMQLIVYPKLLKERLKATQQRLNSYNQKIQEDKKKIERGGIFGIFTKGLTATTLELNQIIQKKLEDNISEIKEEIQLIEKIDILTPGDIEVRLHVLRRQEEETKEKEIKIEREGAITGLLFGGGLSDLNLAYHAINKKILNDTISELEIFQKTITEAPPQTKAYSHDEKLNNMRDKLTFKIKEDILKTKMDATRNMEIDEEKEQSKKEATEAILKRYGARKVEDLPPEGFQEIKKQHEMINDLFESAKAGRLD